MSCYSLILLGGRIGKGVGRKPANGGGAVTATLDGGRISLLGRTLGKWAKATSNSSSAHFSGSFSNLRPLYGLVWGHYRHQRARRTGPVLSAAEASRAGCFRPLARRINSRAGRGKACCAGSTAAGRFRTPTARGFNRRAIHRSAIPPANEACAELRRRAAAISGQVGATGLSPLQGANSPQK